MFDKNKNTKVGDLEVYGEDNKNTENEKENSLTKITNGIKGVWNKTVFPEKIKNIKELKKAKRNMIMEAKMEAIEESKDEIKAKEKEKLINKASGKNKKDFLEKLAKGFGVKEGEGNKIGSSDKISKMLGKGDSTVGNKSKIEGMLSGSNVSKNSEDKISRMLGKGNTTNTGNDKLANMLGTKSKSSKESNEEKIKRMLGR